MKILYTKTIYRDGQYVAFPTLAKLPDGRVLCAFRHAPERQATHGAATHVDPAAKMCIRDSYYTMQRIKLLRGGAVNVLNGPDECLLCGLAMGADGGIGATYNVMPGVFRKLYDAFREGNLQEAQRMQLHANRLIEIIIRFGVQASVKEILARAGYDCGHCLYPMPRLTDEERRRLNDALDAIDYEGEYL